MHEGGKIWNKTGPGKGGTRQADEGGKKYRDVVWGVKEFSPTQKGEEELRGKRKRVTAAKKANSVERRRKLFPRSKI